MTSSAAELPLIEIKEAYLDFAGNRVLNNINLTLNPNEIVTVIGPNGAGKSSLVKLAVGLQTPSQGSVKRKTKLRIGYMPQKLIIDQQLPLNTQRFLSLCGNKAALENAVARLDIHCLLKTPIQKLSGGEMQRVLLARALMGKPELLVLDEPAQGVDVIGQAELYHLIGQLRKELGCGVLMVSHDLHIVMAQTDQVLCLNKHICCHGAPESVSKHPEYLQLFGKKAAADIAIYTHNHDHQHDMHGDVIGDSHHNCQHDHT
ncbi:MAG: zinc ABC transporter ATP-binding protein ZnuC [Marinagarivorans sp.]|nr:zinc ABC transporter ATP-binding protein ZnuC [Marinagarivorans sp.]